MRALQLAAPGERLAVLCLGATGWISTAQTEAIRPLGVILLIFLVLVFLIWIRNNDPYTKQEIELDEYRRRKKC